MNPTPAVKLTEFPEEILVFIFRYLNNYDLPRVGAVCRLFRKISTPLVSSIILHLDESSRNPLLLAKLRNLPQELTNIQHFVIGNAAVDTDREFIHNRYRGDLLCLCRELEDAIPSFFTTRVPSSRPRARFPRLQSFVWQHVSAIEPETLVMLIKLHPDLKHLELSGIGVSDHPKCVARHAEALEGVLSTKSNQMFLEAIIYHGIGTCDLNGNYETDVVLFLGPLIRASWKSLKSLKLSSFLPHHWKIFNWIEDPVLEDILLGGTEPNDDIEKPSLCLEELELADLDHGDVFDEQLSLVYISLPHLRRLDLVVFQLSVLDSMVECLHDRSDEIALREFCLQFHLDIVEDDADRAEEEQFFNSLESFLTQFTGLQQLSLLLYCEHELSVHLDKAYLHHADTLEVAVLNAVAFPPGIPTDSAIRPLDGYEIHRVAVSLPHLKELGCIMQHYDAIVDYICDITDGQQERCLTDLNTLHIRNFPIINRLPSLKTRCLIGVYPAAVYLLMPALTLSV